MMEFCCGLQLERFFQKLKKPKTKVSAELIRVVF